MQFLFKKSHKTFPKKSCTQKNHVLQFGVIGIKNLTNLQLTEDQIKAFEWVLKKILKSQKKKIKLWVKFNLNINLTKLSLESRMGKGKGNIYTTAQFVKAGTIFFEFSETNQQLRNKILTSLVAVFPKKFKLVSQHRKGRETQR